MKETRKTELPTLYEPLVLNCNLLVDMFDLLDKDDSERQAIREILEIDDNGVFLSSPIDRYYSFDNLEEDYQIELSKDKIVIPVSLLIDGATVTMKVNDNGTTTTFDDITIDKVTRDSDTIETFFAEYSSKKMKSYKWTSESKVSITIDLGEPYEDINLDYKVSNYESKWILPDTVEFEQV